MKDNRNLVVLVVVLVVLGGLYALTRDRRPQLDDTGGFVDLVNGTLSTDDVFGVTLTQGVDEAGALQIVQQAGTWTVRSHFDAPANLNKIRTILGNLESVEGEVRSNDASVLGAYALDDSSAYHLVVSNENGEALTELLIGKRSGNGCFVRVPGSDRVLVADHNFLSDFGVWGDDRPSPDPKQWMDLVAFTVKREDVRGLRIEGETTIDMVKEFEEPAAVTPAAGDSTATPPPAPDPEAYEWRVTAPSGFVAAKSRADAILNSLASLRARDVVTRGEAPAEYGLGDEADRVVVTLADGGTKTLLFGAPVEGDDAVFYFRVEGDPLVWSMPNFVRQNVFKSPDDLKVD